MIPNRCNKCNQIGICTCNYFKTIHESNVQINPFSIENQVKYQVESLKYKIKKLPRYDN